MLPRTDGVILGRTYYRGRADLAPAPADRKRIIDRHRAISAQMAGNIDAWRNSGERGSS
ncbi:MAG: hypothetical protein ACI8UZ_001229 [Akkermansiaceae bacterium]|jgi:hypothetical protein